MYAPLHLKRNSRNRSHTFLQASPGNLQDVEDLLFAHSDVLVSPLVVAFKLKTVKGVIHVGAAFADATNRQLGVAEYPDNDLFSNTEVRSCLTQCPRSLDNGLG